MFEVRAIQGRGGFRTGSTHGVGGRLSGWVQVQGDSRVYAGPGSKRIQVEMGLGSGWDECQGGSYVRAGPRPAYSAEWRRGCVAMVTEQGRVAGHDWGRGCPSERHGYSEQTMGAARWSATR